MDPLSHRHTIRLWIPLLLSLLFTSVVRAQFVDCGIPLTREIYYQGVTVSPSSINFASPPPGLPGGLISVNVDANLQSFLDVGQAFVVLQVVKDGAIYVNVSVGDLCSILQSANQQNCPLLPKEYSLSYLYQLPPLPTGDYTVNIITYDLTNTEIGCLSVEATVTDLVAQAACGYTSTLSAQLSGSLNFPNNTIQVGPWGPGGIALNYPWGTFENVVASSDIFGSDHGSFDSFVWGLTGTLNESLPGSVFEGTIVVGYLPDPTVPSGATLVQQGVFSWHMQPNQQATNPPFIFESGTVDFSPKYAFPSGFPYPLALGNLNPYQVVPSTNGDLFSVSASRYWCTCGCPSESGSGDKIGSAQGLAGSNSPPNWELGSIIVGTIGGSILIAVAIIAFYLWRHPRKPMAYDDTDLMDPQKPDYGSIAINEIFEDDGKDYM